MTMHAPLKLRSGRLISRLPGVFCWLMGVMALTAADPSGRAPEKQSPPTEEPKLSDQALSPYEDDTDGRLTPLDVKVREVLDSKKIEAARRCSDAVFVRRVYLDVTGSLPPRREVLYFLNSKAPDKRAQLIDALLEKEEFTDYWTLKWCDLLRVKSEFPINLWPNGVQAYHRWIRDAVKENRPYDQFVRQLLTSSGSNFRVPPVNFYRAVQGRDPEAIAEMVALTFMGVRVHHWSESDRRELTHFFERVAYKKTIEWKEEVVYLSPVNEGSREYVFPDRKRLLLDAGEDPRVAFADWLLREDNPWFAKAVANRAWYWMMGRGVVHPADDLRANNPCANPGLLAYLADELVGSGYDMKYLFRLILNSQTYQQSSISRSDNPYAGAYFAHYTMRRMGAEVLIDALNGFGNTEERYWSPIPEPFTFIPSSKRSITLADGSITSQFLEMFGRPSRDKGYESEREQEASSFQSLYLLNSAEMHRRIGNSRELKAIVREAGRDRRKLVQSLYLCLLSRCPSEAEMRVALDYMATSMGGKKGKFLTPAAQDLAWALLNTKEFLFHH